MADNDGYTALRRAGDQGHGEIVRVLLEAAAKQKWQATMGTKLECGLPSAGM